MHNPSPLGCKVIYQINEHASFLPVQSHDYFEIFIYEQGNIAYIIEDFQIDLIPGDILIIPPNKIHRTFPINNMPQDGYKRFHVYLSNEFIDSLGTDGFNIRECFRNTYHEYGYIARFENEAFKGTSKKTDSRYKIYGSKYKKCENKRLNRV